VRLPLVGTTTLTALTQTGTINDYIDFTTNSVQLLLNEIPDINVVISELDALENIDDQYEYVTKDMEDARDELVDDDYTTALSYMLQATDKLNEITSTQARLIRLKIDALIRKVAIKL